MRRKRDVIDVAGPLLMLGIGCCGLIFLYAWLARFPTPAEAATIPPTRTILAYGASDDVPYVLYRGEGNVAFQALQMSWRPLLRLQTPSWSLTGSADGFPLTGEPASLFAAGCVMTDEPCAEVTALIGQVNAPTIALMEVAIDGQWRRFFVHVPGFIKIVSHDSRLGDVRWLTADERVVWESDRNGDGSIRPLLPGEPRPNPHARFSGQ